MIRASCLVYSGALNALSDTNRMGFIHVVASIDRRQLRSLIDVNSNQSIGLLRCAQYFALYLDVTGFYSCGGAGFYSTIHSRMNHCILGYDFVVPALPGPSSCCKSTHSDLHWQHLRRRANGDNAAAAQPVP